MKKKSTKITKKLKNSFKLHSDKWYVGEGETFK